MKTNYENWMPKFLLDYIKYGAITSATISVVLTVLIFYRKSADIPYYKPFSYMDILFLALTIILFWAYKKFSSMHDAFSYEDKDAISWKIINYTADKMKLDKADTKILDVGCGSGALSIATAKNNPKSKIIGLDKWPPSYKNFSKQLCEDNAMAENITNVEFIAGDAVKIDFPDETFDGLVSNYVYHNIPGNRQDYLLESFRVLKKGGHFAIHDIFVKLKYGDMEAFIQKLYAMGFEKVELIDTTNGVPMTKDVAKKTMLNGSKLLCGIK